MITVEDAKPDGPELYAVWFGGESGAIATFGHRPIVGGAEEMAEMWGHIDGAEIVPLVHRGSEYNALVAADYQRKAAAKVSG